MEEMNKQTVTLPCIGVIRSPFTELKNMPIQPVGAKDVEGRAEIEAHYQEGLKDLDGFSHIYLIYHFHQAPRVQLRVTPYMDDAEHGVFATRSPLRPAHIGMSVVELLRVEGSVLHLRGVDILDGTPLLDVKPYMPQFDARENVRTGWMQKDDDAVASARSDTRFAK